MVNNQYKVRLLQVHAVDNCNFHCDYCTAGSPQSPKKIYTWEDYRPHVERFKEYGAVGRFDIMGGEPFLNPNLAKFTQGFYESGVADSINIVTNGYWIKNWEQHVNVLSLLDSMEITIHPESKISEQEMKRYCQDIFLEEGLKTTVSTPNVFYKTTFTEEPVTRKGCKFCPQMLPDGRLTKCHVIAFNHLYKQKPPQVFLDLQHEGIFDIHTGDHNKLKLWYEGTRKGGLFDACDHCRFMEDKLAVVKHNE